MRVGRAVRQQLRQSWSAWVKSPLLGQADKFGKLKWTRPRVHYQAIVCVPDRQQTNGIHYTLLPALQGPSL